MLYKERYKLTVKPLVSILDANGKPATSHSFRVTGLENADEEMLKNTFENRSYSGGERDTVEEIIVAPDSKSAIIIYKTADSKFMNQYGRLFGNFIIIIITLANSSLSY